MTLAALFAFKGRLSRLGYWRAILAFQIWLAIAWCLGIFAVMAFGRLGGLVFLPFAFMPVAVIATTVRRLHDRNKGGSWLALFTFGPWVLSAVADQLFAVPSGPLRWLGFAVWLASFALNLWGYIEIWFRRGSLTTNRFGEVPTQS